MSKNLSIKFSATTRALLLPVAPSAGLRGGGGKLSHSREPGWLSPPPSRTDGTSVQQQRDVRYKKDAEAILSTPARVGACYCSRAAWKVCSRKPRAKERPGLLIWALVPFWYYRFGRSGV